MYFGEDRFQTTIGGTGLAVSAASRFPEQALDFARFVAEAECQRTMYVQHGGQPGHRGAWIDPEADRLTGGFFSSVLPVMQRGYLRPRYHGYLHFQDQAGDPLRDCLMKGGDPDEALDAMDAMYRDSISSINLSNHR